MIREGTLIDSPWQLVSTDLRAVRTNSGERKQVGLGADDLSQPTSSIRSACQVLGASVVDEVANTFAPFGFSSSKTKNCAERLAEVFDRQVSGASMFAIDKGPAEWYLSPRVLKHTPRFARSGLPF